MRTILKVILLIFIAQGLAAGCRSRPNVPLGVRDTEHSLEHEGRQRRWLLHEPPAATVPAKGAPLLLMLHGGGGTPESSLQLTLGRFNVLADSHGFFVAYPAGIDRSWNDQRNDPISTAHIENIDDVGFFKKMIDRIATERPIDRSRVFVTGISNGGFMSMRLACELAGTIAGAAPVTAQLPKGGADCSPAVPLSLLIINGTADPLVPYDGGVVKVFWRERGEIFSTQETIDRFRAINGCSAEPRRTELPDIDPEDESRVVRFDYDGCRNGTQLSLLRIEGGGHTWPGGWQYLDPRAVRVTNRDIDACDEIARFFHLVR